MDPGGGAQQQKRENTESAANDKMDKGNTAKTPRDPGGGNVPHSLAPGAVPMSSHGAVSSSSNNNQKGLHRSSANNSTTTTTSTTSGTERSHTLPTKAGLKRRPDASTVGAVSVPATNTTNSRATTAAATNESRVSTGLHKAGLRRRSDTDTAEPVNISTAPDVGTTQEIVDSPGATPALVEDNNNWHDHSIRRNDNGDDIEEEEQVEFESMVERQTNDSVTNNIAVPAPPTLTTSQNSVDVNQQRPADDRLVQARPVLEESESNIDRMPQAQQVDLEAQRAKVQQDRRRLNAWMALGTVAILAAGVAIAVGVVMGTKHESVPVVVPSSTPLTIMPTNAPTGILDDFVMGLISNGTTTQASLLKPDSPQSLALNWLSEYPNILDLPSWRREQLYALSTFYYSFGGPSWPNNLGTDWVDSSKSECDWFSSDFGSWGVGPAVGEQWTSTFKESDTPREPCDLQGRFVNLHLRSALDMRGQRPSVPSEMSLLRSLKSISLVLNGIDTPLQDLIPSELSLLPDLFWINLSFNEAIHGTIPAHIHKSTALWFVQLNNNNITGPLPSELGLMSSQRMLMYLGNNALTGTIPTNIGTAEKWTILDIKGNHLSGAVPSQIGLLSNLIALELQKNQFTGTVPTEIFWLTNLNTLKLDASLMPTIPTELNLLTNLTDFVLVGEGGDNTTRFPMNIFNGISDFINELDLTGQLLSGTIPTEVGLLSNLVAFRVDNNLFTGPIPSELFLCTKLAHLHMTGNLLTGPVPSEIGNVFNLDAFSLAVASGGLIGELMLYDNSLSGTLPSQIGNCVGLFNVELYSNSLSGSIPSEISGLRSLITLDLGFNSLTGPIPDGIVAGAIWLNDNRLVGTIPSFLWTPGTIGLSVARNMLSSTIPTELAKLAALQMLSVGSNRLTGTIPSEFAALRGGAGTATRFLRLFFQDNALTGPVPQQYVEPARAGTLVDFNISKNNLTGTVPEGLCFMGLGSCSWVAFNEERTCIFDHDCTAKLCGCNCTCSPPALIDVVGNGMEEGGPV